MLRVKNNWQKQWNSDHRSKIIYIAKRGFQASYDHDNNQFRVKAISVKEDCSTLESLCFSVVVVAFDVLSLVSITRQVARPRC